MKRIVYISLLVLFAACSSEESPSEVSSIASLRDRVTNYRSVLIEENITIEGYIVANDEYGEFYNTLIIEDQSAALKLLCEADDLYQQFPFGSRVKFCCGGLYLQNYYGSIRVGAEPTGDYTLDYITSEDLGRYLNLSTLTNILPQPSVMTIGELTPTDSYRYVELRDVQLLDTLGITTFCSRNDDTGRSEDTTHIIVDKDGATMELFVDGLCRYGDASLPTESTTLQIIVDYYDGEYSATITSCGY